jgi:hypothetical protein
MQKYMIRLDVIHSIQTLVFPNGLALAPTTTTKLTFFSRHPTTQLVHSTSRILQHMPLYRPYITPSKQKNRQPRSIKSHHDIAQRPNKHEISYTKLVTVQKSKKSYHDISYENYAA